ncbi:serine hydrolase domain-containing protein [uncultured Herbaspirillum sp.]|uniref:serine hydrolase domain-containing protein n=1 Tax=uncultured Herbaspirillum sp. TaxID=160236 RepID=UPI0026120DAC|nr:serine hydrolase domain-containing protein [uncultured Herbaspirillum sp.]
MNFMRGFIRVTAVTFLLATIQPASAQSNQSVLPTDKNGAVAPDDWLIGKGRAWFYHGLPAASPSPLNRREPTEAEKPVVDKARALFAARPAKVMVLIDGHDIVYKDAKSPVNDNSYLFSFSMGKTITSMAVGKAICAGKLTLATRADDVISELKGKDLGAATVADLLKMASGTTGGESDATMLTAAQNKLWGEGRLNLLDAIVEDRLSRAKRGLFSSYKPGELFWYKSTDPVTLGIMVGNAVGMPFSKWTTENVLQAAGIARPVIIGEDKFGHVQADGNYRMVLDDWIRFVIWVKDSSKADGCFGDYVRQATTTQIKNTQKNAGKFFDEYGFLVWTYTGYAPNSYWANGYGGQRIGWSRDKDRELLLFSNSEEWIADAYQLMNDWGADKK